MSGQVGHNKPFRAPIYRTYWECIKGLNKQGILGFYKGNGLRLSYYVLYMHCIQELNHNYIEGEDVLQSRTSFLKIFSVNLAACTCLHFLHLAEARFVLQNRLPSFRTYKSLPMFIRDSFSSARGDLFNGFPAYLPILTCLTLQQS